MISAVVEWGSVPDPETAKAVVESRSDLLCGGWNWSSHRLRDVVGNRILVGPSGAGIVVNLDSKQDHVDDNCRSAPIRVCVYICNFFRV